MKKMWYEIVVFPVTEQILADQARQIQTNKWLTDVEIEKIRRKLERKNSKVEVQENVQEIIEHNENKQGQLEERGPEEILFEQGHVNEQQQKTYHVCSFSEDDEILVKKAAMERCNEEKNELLMRVAKEITYDPERIPPNLRYIDRENVREATVKINKIVSLIKTETITETNSVLRAAGNVVAEMVGYKNKKMAGDRQPNWRRRILEKEKVLRKELGQLNRMRRGELQNEGVTSKLERKFNIKGKSADVVHKEVQQRLVAVGAKLQKYDNRTKQYRQNRLFKLNQKRLFKELEGAQRESVIADAEESRHFWSNI